MARTINCKQYRTGKRWNLKRDGREGKQKELMEWNDPSVPWYALDPCYMMMVH